MIGSVEEVKLFYFCVVNFGRLELIFLLQFFIYYDYVEFIVNVR
jgi:hypothetical protein